jgi:hypothetical protein
MVKDWILDGGGGGGGHCLGGSQVKMQDGHLYPAVCSKEKKNCYNLEAWLRIRIHFIRIRIQHFRLNTDPDPGL